MKLFEALVNDYRTATEKCIGTNRVSGDHLANARSALYDLFERAQEADAAIVTLDATLPVGVCARCGKTDRCVAVDPRDGEGRRDTALCPACVRKERAILQEQVEQAKKEERRLREEVECLQGILKKHESFRDKVAARLSDVDPDRARDIDG
jgi:hypothetical protein